MSDFIEHYYQMLEPYLPSTLRTPLHSLLTIPQTIYSDPSQVVPLLLSVFALWAAITSFLSTTRWLARTGLWLAKWSAVAAGIAAMFGWVKVDDLKNAAGQGAGLAKLGARGAAWMTGVDIDAYTDAFRSTGNQNAWGGSKSGAKRDSWADSRVNDGASRSGWGSSGDRTQGDDVMDKVKDSVLSFLSAAGSGSKDNKKDGNPVANFATDFLANQAKKAMDSL